MYLLHIHECIQRIEDYTRDGQRAFEASSLIQDGVVRNLEIIGEATRRFSSEIKQLYSEIPWKQIAGMRDVLIHDYMGVNLSEVWNVVAHDLPDLKHTIVVMLQEVSS
jgi:uncharacterized protein with HEPN domain